MTAYIKCVYLNIIKFKLLVQIIDDGQGAIINFYHNRHIPAYTIDDFKVGYCLYRS